MLRITIGMGSDGYDMDSAFSGVLALIDERETNTKSKV